MVKYIRQLEGVMFRFLYWFVLWLCTLCAIDISVKYADGLRIKFKGWMTPVINWVKEKRKVSNDL